MSKAVILNSGGFDSVVLSHYLKYIQGENELHSLHFKYGALNEDEQFNCVKNVCNKLGIDNKVINLPPIDWTVSNFFQDTLHTKETQYLEYRNLIFMSYAISYAEAIGAKKIYLAFLNNSEYTDDSVNFLRNLNKICEVSSIEIDAPFIFDSKTRLWHIAKYLNIGEEEYFSCDKPVKGRPCGECLDCQILESFKSIKTF